LNQEELQLFLATCKRTGLDPFSRQIYSTVSEWKDKKGNHQRKINIQATVDGFRVIAERSGNYAGQSGPYWCGNDGEWKDVWLMQEPPRASKVGVLRKDFKEPIWAVANYDSYRQDYSPVWNRMPEQMLAKCAESLALRKAFPNDLAGLYSDSEMAQSEVIERPVEQKKEIKNYAPTVTQLNAPPLDDSPDPVFDDTSQPMSTANDMYNELNNWKIPFGKHLKRSLLDLGFNEAKKYGDWLLGESKKTGKPPSPGAQKYQEMLQLYGCYVQEVESEKNAKIMNPPTFNVGDEIPF
jgi:phage recombination protein Bet